MHLDRVNPVCVFGISKQTLSLFRMDLFWDAYDKGEGCGSQKYPPSPKSVTHPSRKKLGRYTLPEDPKKSHDTPLEFC